MAGMSKMTLTMDKDVNYWETNPHMIYLAPFSKLYETDNGGIMSSRTMWTVVFICNPDEEENKFFRFGRKGVEEIVLDIFHPDLDVEDDLYNECLKAYPDTAMDSVQRDLMNKKMHLRQRAEFLVQTPYDIENAAKLDMMHSKTAKIMEEYDQILDKYLQSKSKGKVKGGRGLSKSETGEV